KPCFRDHKKGTVAAARSIASLDRGSAGFETEIGRSELGYGSQWAGPSYPSGMITAPLPCSSSYGECAPARTRARGIKNLWDVRPANGSRINGTWNSNTKWS